MQDYRDAGCSVVDLHGVGFGCPDLMIGCAGRTELVEVKTDEGELSPGQVVFVRDWRGSKVVIVRNRDGVMVHVQAIRRRVVEQSWRPPPVA